MLSEEIQLVSNFNIHLLKPHVKKSIKDSIVDVAAYGQVFQSITSLQEQPEYDKHVVLWTSPEGVISKFNQLLCGKSVSHNEVLDEVKEYKNIMLTTAKHCKTLFIPTWTMPLSRRTYGMIDLKPELGVRHLIMRMNLELMDLMLNVPNLFVLDADAWLKAAGAKAYPAKLYFTTKTLFSNDVFSLAAKDIAAAINGISGQAKKLIVLDLDNTLWGGVLGDEGWEKLKIGGHDYVGEAFLKFQNSIIGLNRRGILLAIASKNDESTALKAIELHPEMLLKEINFSAWRINWNDKAKNLIELADELNLGLQSMVFIDDNPVERARIREALPEVLVPEWPNDPALYTETLESLRCFDAPQVTHEDLNRGKMYVAERLRRKSRIDNEINSSDEWLNTLETSIHVESLSEVNLTRVVQLFNKTNQLNLTTRRFSESDIVEWIKIDGHELWVIYVKDKYGDSGMSGIISIETVNGTTVVCDLILSCRVMGRKIEDAMLHVVTEFALQNKINELMLEYKATEKNAPCLKMMNDSSLKKISKHKFVWEGEVSFSLPECISID